VYWAKIKGAKEDKDRLCVVMEENGEYRWVAYGQGEPGLGAFVKVSLGSTDGNRLHVTKDTYFRETNFQLLKIVAFKSYVGRCPPQLFQLLNELRQSFLLSRRVQETGSSESSTANEGSSKE
jgi:hypothetical protein